MRLHGALHGTAGQRPGFGHQLGRALCFLPVLALFAPAVWAQTPAGTQINSFAQATYEASNGLTFTAYSDTLIMVVAQVVGLAALPLCLALFRRLPDRGYALSKPFALLLVGYIFWILNLLHVLPNSAGGIVWALIFLAAGSGIVVWRRRDELLAFARAHETFRGRLLAVDDPPPELVAGGKVRDVMHRRLATGADRVEVDPGSGRGDGDVVEDSKAPGAGSLELVAGIAVGVGLTERSGLCRDRHGSEQAERQRCPGGSRRGVRAHR